VVVELIKGGLAKAAGSDSRTASAVKCGEFFFLNCNWAKFSLLQRTEVALPLDGSAS